MSAEGLSAKERGNKVNSYDPNRTDARAEAFKSEYAKLENNDAKKNQVNVKCGG